MTTWLERLRDFARGQYIPDAAALWQLWSVQIAAIGALVSAIVAGSPDLIVSAWAAMPAEVVALVPESIARWILPGLFVATIVARGARQAAPGGTRDGE